MKKLLVLLPFLAVGFLFLSLNLTKVHASIIEGSPCTTASNCTHTDGYNAFCMGGMCTYAPITSTNKLEEEIKNCEQSNSLSLGCFNNKVFVNIIDAGNLAISGPQSTSGRASLPGGAIGAVAGLITSLYNNPPASGIEYFADLGKNFGFTKPVYAQGVGFAGFSRILPLWKASRNLAYVLFIIAFLYIGLAIMFRVKISPQAVATIQNMLPKLVIGLILVTFSYAIVGLLIDLIYLMIYVGILAIGQTDWIDVAAEQAKYASLSFGEGLGIVFGALFFKGGIGLIAAALGGIVGAIALPGLALLGALGGAGLVTLIVGVISLYCIFKLFIALLGCYISIIISIIAGPLQIMTGVIPGNQGGFGNWFKNLMANILVFPAVALALLIGWLLTGSHGPTWSPPVISASGGLLNSFLGLGILLLLPKIPDMIKNAFKMKPAGYGQAIGEVTGAPKRLVGGAIGIGTTLANINKSYGELTSSDENPKGTSLVGLLRRRPSGGSLKDNLV